MRVFNSVTILVSLLLYLASRGTCFSLEKFEGSACKEGLGDVTKNNVSYSTCLDECKARDSCMGVSYHSGTKTCLVHEEDAETLQDKAVCKGFVYSDKQNWLKTFLCRSPECDTTRAACSADNDICKYQDCREPKPSNGALLLHGNLRTIDATIDYTCKRNHILVGENSLSCLPGGRWSHSFPSCSSSKKPPNKPATMTTTPRAETATTTTTSRTTETTTTTTTSTTETPTTTTTPSTTSPKTTPQTSNQICPHGWNLKETSCYLLDDTKRTFEEARKLCNYINAAMAVPYTQSENAYIKSILKAASSYWVGFKLTSGAWMTSAGTSLETLGYSDWAKEGTTSDASDLTGDKTTTAGAEQETSSAGAEQETPSAGTEQETSNAGAEQETPSAGTEQETSSAGAEQVEEVSILENCAIFLSSDSHRWSATNCKNSFNVICEKSATNSQINEKVYRK